MNGKRFGLLFISSLLALLLVLTGSAPGNQQASANPLRKAIAQVQQPEAPEALMGTAFTYQGYLEENGAPASNPSGYDFIFRLYDAPSAGVKIGSDLTIGDVPVSKGLFTVTLDFGASAFTGDARYLDISVRLGSSTGSYTLLSPRQALNAVPYALNADLLDGAQASSFVNIAGSTMTGRLSINPDATSSTMRLYGGPLITESSLDTKWNLSTTNSAGAEMAIIGAGPDTTTGLGFIIGDNVTSPVLFMYSADGRNAFTVAATNYSGTGSDISNMDSRLVPLFQVRENGRVGIGTVNPQAKLDVAGTTLTDILQIDGGADLAEPFEILGAENVIPGLLVAIDPDHPGQLGIAAGAYDRKVVGCVSGANGLNPGLVMQQKGSLASGSFPVALSGRVYCWADASYGAIHPGDLLTSSDTPGHVMLVSDHQKAQGAIIGKAMSVLEEGLGLILVLVTLQ